MCELVYSLHINNASGVIYLIPILSVGKITRVHALTAYLMKYFATIHVCVYQFMTVDGTVDR